MPVNFAVCFHVFIPPSLVSAGPADPFPARLRGAFILLCPSIARSSCGFSAVSQRGTEAPRWSPPGAGTWPFLLPASAGPVGWSDAFCPEAPLVPQMLKLSSADVFPPEKKSARFPPWSDPSPSGELRAVTLTLS